MLAAKDKAVKGLTGGIEFLFKKNKVIYFVKRLSIYLSINKVDYVKGHGKLIGPNEIEVQGIDGNTSKLRAKQIILATGSEASPFPGMEVKFSFPKNGIKIKSNM